MFVATALGVCVVCAVAVTAVTVDPASDIVQLPDGRGSLRGEVRGDTRAFRAIPYALPPTKERRWRPPEPAAPWGAKVLDARNAGPSCMQDPGFAPPIWSMSEDCLSLSVCVNAGLPACRCAAPARGRETKRA